MISMTGLRSTSRIFSKMRGQHKNFDRLRKSSECFRAASLTLAATTLRRNLHRNALSSPSSFEWRRPRGYLWMTVLTGGSLCGAGFLTYINNSDIDEKRRNELGGAPLDLNDESTSSADDTSTELRDEKFPGNRRITLDELAQHFSEDIGIWVAYEDSVYDITDFVEQHPGGRNAIMLAAGGKLDPYWKILEFHRNHSVLKILEEYRIGTLVDDLDDEEHEIDDPFESDPERDPSLTVFCRKPFLAEPPLDVITRSYITPNELFYVRNHMAVPLIHPEEYQLDVSVEGTDKMINLSLDDLKTKFKKHNVVVTLQCAGNRCSDMQKADSENYVDVGGGAGNISTAEWGGALLRDVLKQAGIDEDYLEGRGYKHVQLEGLDADLAGTHYDVSIPIHHVMSRKGDVLLAYEMNGKELPRDHGYPVRCIIPGTAGARNVKWIGNITLSKEESSSVWQQRSYKGYPPGAHQKNVDVKAAQAIYELPVTSVICSPLNGATIDSCDGGVTLSGYAWSGGGRGINRVDVSIDGGKTWEVAELNCMEQEPGRAWAWSIWKATIPIPRGTDKLDLVCKAVDSSFNVQPESVGPIYNYRGYLSNAWHVVNVDVSNKNA